MSTALVFVTFWVLVIATYARRERRARLPKRSLADFALDGSGLLVQGALVPQVQVLVGALFLRRLWPELEGGLRVGPVLAFFLNFVGVDCLYYWNHRLLHSRLLWPVHATHHSAEELDVLVTARNTLWTPLLIVYLWANTLGAFLLDQPGPFVLSAALTAALDLWRHSRIAPPPGSPFDRILGAVLITPHDHARHHGRWSNGSNFGANLKLWDVLHGTYGGPFVPGEPLGNPAPRSFWRRLLLPVAAARQ